MTASSASRGLQLKCTVNAGIRIVERRYGRLSLVTDCKGFRYERSDRIGWSMGSVEMGIQRDPPKRTRNAVPDGTLTATSIRVDEMTTAVTLSAVWRNRGPLPIKLCKDHSVIKAFRLGNMLPIGNLKLRDMATVSEVKADWSEYVLEPNTDSVMTEHFVLKNDGIYGFEWTICLGQAHSGVTSSTYHFDCTRELLLAPDLDAVDRPHPAGKKSESG